MNVRDVLVKARELIATPERWRKGGGLVTHGPHGAWTAVAVLGDTSPNTFCAHDAAIAASRSYSHAVDAVAALNRAASATHGNAAQLNDAATTTHADVLALFDRAIAACEAT